MTEILELSEDFKAAIIKMIKQTTNENQKVSAKIEDIKKKMEILELKSTISKINSSMDDFNINIKEGD